MDVLIGQRGFYKRVKKEGKKGTVSICFRSENEVEGGQKKSFDFYGF